MTEPLQFFPAKHPETTLEDTMADIIERGLRRPYSTSKYGFGGRARRSARAAIPTDKKVRSHGHTGARGATRPTETKP